MSLRELSERELVRRCRRNEASAWRELVRRTSPTAYRLARRMLRDEGAAEDATQETMMQLYRSFERFDASRPLAPWVARIAYTTCLMRMRGAMTRASVATDPQALLAVADGVDDPERDAAAREERAHVEDALDTLDSQDRALLLLRYREGLFDSDIAAATGMPVNTVKSRILRARRKLKDVLWPLRGEAT